MTKVTKYTTEQKNSLRRELDYKMRKRLEGQYAMILDLQLKKSRSSLVYYAELVNPGWKKTRLMAFLLPKIQEFVEDKGDYRGVEILILNVPPQSGKSLSVTETVPSWYIGRNDTARVLIVTYGDDLAQRFGRRNKQKVINWGDKVFGVKIGVDKKSNTEFELSNGIGGVTAAGVMSGITGRPAELIIIDDPIRNREQADSDTYREKLWQEFENSIYTRLQANGKIIVIQTRWHEDDLTGRIIKSEAYNSRVINIPCEADENDILGRTQGEPLVPELGKGKAWLEKTKKAYLEGKNEDIKDFGSGPRAWHALYQGTPTVEGGNIFKEDWWRYYTHQPSKFDFYILSVDCSFKDEADNDYVVLQAWGKFGMNIYLLDNIRGRMDFPTTVQAIRDMKAKHPFAREILVEDKANGPAVISTLKKEIYGIVAITPLGNKVSRAHQVTYAIETGYVLLPQFAGWLPAFLEEAKRFPRGSFDDQVDSMTQALGRLLKTPNMFHEQVPDQEGFFTPGELERRRNKEGYVSIRRVKKELHDVDDKKDKGRMLVI